MELDYWRWLWRQKVPTTAKFAVGALLLALVLVGGWFAADRLTAAEAKTADSIVLQTTVQKVVTVREKGKLVTKVIPVVKRVVRIQSKTATATDRVTQLKYQTQYVTRPGTVRVVRRVVTSKVKVPVVTTKVVKERGKTRTVAVTNFVPTTRTETQVRTETQRQTVTNTLPGNTVTQTTIKDHTTTQTNTQTQTVVNTTTVTQTQTQTVVQTTTNTVTETQTQTQTQTVTVTTPGDTITVTITVPGGGGGP